MGRLRHRVIEQENGHRVGWVCDMQAYSGPYNFTNDPRKIFSEKDIDAVFIATPNHLIKDLVIKALDSGKHVFAEKPPGVSSREVREMIAAEQRNPGRILMFGFNHRYHGSVVEAKKRIDSGEFGRILWMRGRYGKSVDDRFFDNWRAKREKAGGGILMDQGIHMLDLLMLFADGFDEVKSFCSNLYWNINVEDNVFALLKNNSNNIVASFHSTMTQWRHLFALEIFLEKGYLTINGLITSSMTYTTTWGKEVLTIAINRTPPPEARHAREERIVFDEDNSWKIEVDEFFDAVKNQRKVRNGTSEESLALMDMIESIYRNDTGWS